MAQMIHSDIEKLRNKLNMNQSEFGALFGKTPMAVSRWERGVNMVPAHTLFALGLLARKIGLDGWGYWGLAGLTRKDAQTMLGWPLRNPPASLSKSRPESH
jgi:transcriptional regulator with XRE-family HTH domain